ncbi:hypothetical protein CSQ96_10780 [Janthinobacterium sp. BJB412]|nr:hypothetical protein CSQ96_10780 [Janthinobacterium sp. BJB412]
MIISIAYIALLHKVRITSVDHTKIPISYYPQTGGMLICIDGSIKADHFLARIIKVSVKYSAVK